jgi:hypothetical protein
MVSPDGYPDTTLRRFLRTYLSNDLNEGIDIQSGADLVQVGIIDQQGDNGFRPYGRELARNITACAVKAGARGTNIGITTVGPIDEVRHRL